MSNELYYYKYLKYKSKYLKLKNSIGGNFEDDLEDRYIKSR